MVINILKWMKVKHAFLRNKGTEYELQKIKDILNEFRVSFDVWFSETSLYEMIGSYQQLKIKSCWLYI